MKSLKEDMLIQVLGDYKMVKGYYEVEAEKVKSPTANIRIYGEKGETRHLFVDEKSLKSIRKVLRNQDKRQFEKGEQTYDYDKAPRGR